MHDTKTNNCIECDKDISHKGNRSVRCDSCQTDYTNKRRRLLRKNKYIDNPRTCNDCGTGIAYYPPNSLYCKACRKAHKATVDHDYYIKNKEHHASVCSDYYLVHRDEILASKRTKSKKKRLSKNQRVILQTIKDNHSTTIRGTHNKANGTFKVLITFLSFINETQKSFRTTDFGKRRKYSECPIGQYECIQALILAHKQGLVEQVDFTSRRITWRLTPSALLII